MNGKDGNPADAGVKAPLPAVPGHSSGEGAKTALEALIRKRRMATRPEPPEPKQPPEQPPT
jgi:hypothetical protein